MGKELSDEFKGWPMSPENVASATQIREKFDELLEMLILRTPPSNARYLALVKTKLEEACFFAVKGIAKPQP